VLKLNDIRWLPLIAAAVFCSGAESLDCNTRATPGTSVIGTGTTGPAQPSSGIEGQVPTPEELEKARRQVEENGQAQGPPLKQDQCP